MSQREEAVIIRAGTEFVIYHLISVRLPRDGRLVQDRPGEGMSITVCETGKNGQQQI
jgi:hypothetical protein